MNEHNQLKTKNQNMVLKLTIIAICVTGVVYILSKVYP